VNVPVIGERPEISLDRIFVATDFTKQAENAMAFAAALARSHSSALTLVNVIDLSIISASVNTLVGPAVAVLKETSESLLKEAVGRLPGLAVQTKLLEEFSPSNALLSIASEASLLVMGTTSKHALEKFVVGSVAEQVLRSAPCPVLTVGPKVPRLSSEYLTLHNILFATDFSSQAAKAAPFALAFAEDSVSNLYLCHVDPKEQTVSTSDSFLSALERIVPRSAYDWCNPRAVVEHGQADRAILELAENVDADLIVLGARKASFWLEHIHTGLTPALLAEARCPVLTVC
jgi:nucleotide-binding universal stress UspA family protein